MRKRIAIAVATFGGLGLIAVAMLLMSRKGIGGGVTSVGDTSVHHVSIRPDGRISLVVWSDLTGKGASSSEGDLFTSSAEGFFSSADGRRIDWRWKAPREKGGDFRINGIPHDLAGGTLFLVTTKGGQVRVAQLDADLSALRADREGFEAFAKTQPKVAQFIAEASRPQ